jgi:hypothetical protein
MRAYEFLSESQGGIMRRAQEVAQGKTVSFAKGDHKLELTGTAIIPEGPELRFETHEELEQALKDVLAANGNPTVPYYSKLQPKSGAALVTLWKDESGKPFAFVKFANSKKSGAFPIVWTNSEFTAETGYVQADSKIAQRAQFNLKPNALFQTDKYIPVSNLAETISARDDLPPEVNEQIKQLLSNVESGNSAPVPGAAQYISTYEIDLGESAAPIALVTGNFISGSYKEAEDALLAPLGLTWKTINNVLFPGGGSNLLYDSYLQLDKSNTLKISSKDKKGGAAAAVTGLMKEIQNNPERFAEVTDNPDYQEILGIVETVASTSAVDGPLELAVRFGMISQDEARTVKEHWNKGEKYSPNAPWAKTPGIASALKRKGAKFEDPAYDMGFHVLAGIAELVADRLNQLKNIDNFFRAVLERSTMVQVKAKMQKSGDGAAYTNFTVIYPPVFTGSIKVVAGNNYMATRKPIGKISFKIG